ncbi:hypothetical protein A3L22_25540 [Streptomyces griseus subsp. griseus]|nr:hypothetical protein A3L22_25540 [Streptomyces griseus subsp. griseus]
MAGFRRDPRTGAWRGVPAEDASVTRAVELANQHRYLRQGTGPCAGCAAPVTGGVGTTGGGGRR